MTASNITIPDIELQVQRLTRDIQQWEAKKMELEKQIEPARKELEAWELIMKFRGGAPVQHTQPAANTPSQMEKDAYGSRGRLMREHILASKELGVTPRTVLEFMNKSNMPVSANYVYKTLAKMVVEGLLDFRGGIYRPVIT
jgi:hypothetical protein